MNCQSHTLAIALAGNPAADQRRLHRIGARARQTVSVQGIVLRDLARIDVTDHLSGQEAIGADGTRQFGDARRRLTAQLGPARGEWHDVDRHVGDPPVLQHQGRGLQQRLRLPCLQRALDGDQSRSNRGRR